MRLDGFVPKNRLTCTWSGAWGAEQKMSNPPWSAGLRRAVGRCIASACAVFAPAAGWAQAAEPLAACAVAGASFGKPAGWKADVAADVAGVFETSAANLALLRMHASEADGRAAKRASGRKAALALAAAMPSGASALDWQRTMLSLAVAEDNQRRSAQEARALREAFERACEFHTKLLADLPRCADGQCMALRWKGRLPDFAKAVLPQDKAVAGLSEAARTSQERVNKLRAKLPAAVLSGDQTAARAQVLSPGALGLDGNPARAGFDAGFEARQAVAEAQRASNALVALSQALAGARGPEEAAAAWESWEAGFLIDAHLRLALAMADEAYGIIETADIDVRAAGIGDTPEERSRAAAFLRAARNYPDAGLLLSEEGVKLTASSKESQAVLKLNLDAVGKLFNQQTSLTLSTPIASGAKSGQLYSTVDGKVGVPTVRLSSSVVSSLGQDRWVKWQFSIFGVTGSWGSKQLEHYEPGDLSAPVRTRINPWSLGGFWTLAPAAGGWVSTLRIERQHAWTAAPDGILCTPPASADFKCVSGPGARATAKLSTVSRLDVRRKLRSADIALQVRYDTADKSTQVEVPVYFIRTEDSPKKPFSAGVTLGWNKKDKGWVGVFVGAPFSLLER